MVKSKTEKSNAKHWDAIFSCADDTKLGWYENDVSQTLTLLAHVPGWEGFSIFLPGVGTSILVDELLSKGAKLILNDISHEALDTVKNKLSNKNEEIIWLCQDIAQPIREKLPDIKLWIDRAVLHFLTDKNDVKAYFDNVKSILTIGGYILFAEFSKTGATKCAGLDLQQYSVEELSANLGTSFKLVSHFDHVYFSPDGNSKPYIYALYKRQK